MKIKMPGQAQGGQNMRSSKSPIVNRKSPIISPITMVTGGAGFIGSHLVERLLADGKAVTVIDDCSTGSLENLRAVAGHPRLRMIQSKVSACAALPKLIARAEAIYHLAAAVGVELVVKSPIHVLETNLHETEVLLQAAAAHRVPVLLTSTSEVYGKSRKAEFAEEDDLLIGPPHQARWSYACSKLMDEFLALAYARERSLPVVIVRLFNTVGPRQTGRYGMVLPRFIAAAQAGRPLRVYGDGRQTRCFCYVGDTVEALVRLQNCPAARGGIFNVGSTEEISIRVLAELVVRTLKSKSAIELVSYDKAYAPGFEDMRRRKPAMEKLAQTIQFQPATSLRTIIELAAAAD
jgi:UDP-glucose 4-epimerase